MATSVAWVPLMLMLCAGMGLVMVALGVRGRAVLSAPRCARCGYDVRGQAMTADGVGTCPECGSDLRVEGAVSFGRYRRRPKLIVAGVGVMLLAVASVPALMLARGARVVAVGGPAGWAGPLSGLSNGQLISKLAAGADLPMEWQEMDRRVAAGMVSKGEVDQAVVALITSLEARQARGRGNQPLHWADRFAAGVLAGSDVSPGRKAELLRAFYRGAEPEYEMRTKVREGEELQVDVGGQAPWGIGGSRLVYALGPVVADGGTEVRATAARRRGETGNHPDLLSAEQYFNARVRVPIKLPVGRHELEFACDMGVVSGGETYRGIDGKPGVAEKWPKPLARWRATTRRVVEVVPAGTEVVEVVTDAALDPFRTVSVAVEEMAVRPASGGMDLVMRWKVGGGAEVALAYRVIVRAGGEEIDGGSWVREAGGSGSMTSSRSVRLKKGLAPGVREAEVVLVPDRAVAEERPGVERIWGGERVIKGVKVEWFDLEGR